MRRFGLIGRPLGHSASAAYFTEKFNREGITDCEYSLYELGSIGDLPGLLECLPELCGLNVTIPYKRDVMAFLDSVSPEAEAIGAVNCIRRTADGRLAGHNTDVIGLRAALNELLGAAQPGQALVLGTGGASQAVQYALAERDIPFALVSREAAKGNYTYDDLPCEAVEASRLIVNASPVGTYPNVDAAPRILVSREAAKGNYTYDDLPCEAVEASRLIVNASPVGTYPNVDAAPRIPYAYVTPEHYLLDLVYNPPLTQFLDYGRQRGAHILNGRTMFVEQAEASWRIWNA